MLARKFTALIVDDDIRSREVMEYHLRTIPEIEIIGDAKGADEAFQIILRNVPDIVFLDVEMPGKTGFDLVNDLRKVGIHPCIVFQTAFNKYAIEAIRNAAFDYLLKPIDRDELLVVLARYRDANEKGQFEKRVDRLMSYLGNKKKIRLNSRNGFILIDPDEIYYCLAEWNYTDIYYGDSRKATSSLTLRKIQELLPKTSFIRVNRSTVINLKYLTEVSRKDSICILQIPEKSVQFKITREGIKALENLE